MATAKTGGSFAVQERQFVRILGSADRLQVQTEANDFLRELHPSKVVSVQYQVGAQQGYSVMIVYIAE